MMSGGVGLHRLLALVPFGTIAHAPDHRGVAHSVVIAGVLVACLIILLAGVFAARALVKKASGGGLFCPDCGHSLKAGETACPFCGRENRAAETTDA